MKKLSTSFLFLIFLYSALINCTKSYGQDILMEAFFQIHQPNKWLNDTATVAFPSDERSYALNFYYEQDWRSSKLSLGVGAAYKNYGYSLNKSLIPYFTIPLSLNYSILLGESWFIYGKGSIEVGRIIEAQYSFPDPQNSTNLNYQLFLHKNDLVSYSYGFGFGIIYNRLRIFGGINYSRQLDNFDLSYGKTIGANSLDVGIRYRLFKL